MNENGIKVDYEWAYNQVVLSHDFAGKDPAWVKSFVEGWRQGYLNGFLLGWTEATITTVCRMKQEGFTPEKISEITDLSTDVVSMIFGKEC